MKICLGMMVHRDSHWLNLHLPAFVRYFDGIVAVGQPDNDDETVNAIVQCRRLGISGEYYEYPFNNNWSEMFNHVIDHAESSHEKYDAIIRLDPDEAMFGADISTAAALLTQYAILCFPRINYWQDRLHYTPVIYPDWQARAWQLNKGIRLGGAVHEGIGWTKHNMFEGGQDDTPREVLRVPSIPIHHYGNVGKERILERDLFYLNLERQKAGLPVLTERPADRAFPTRHNIMYHAQQPIDPIAVGLYAPFKE